MKNSLEVSVGTGRKSTFSAECGTREGRLCMGGCVCGSGAGVGRGPYPSSQREQDVWGGGVSFQEENKNRRELFPMTGHASPCWGM